MIQRLVGAWADASTDSASVRPSWAQGVVVSLLVLLLGWKARLLWAVQMILWSMPTWAILGVFAQDVLVWCVIFALAAPLVSSRAGKTGAARGIVVVTVCNLTLCAVMCDVQCKVAFMQPLTFELFVSSLREAKTLYSSASYFVTPKFLATAVSSLAALNAAPLLLRLHCVSRPFVWATRQLPPPVAATLSPLLLAVALFYPPLPYLTDGNILSDRLVAGLRGLRRGPAVEQGETCDEPARALGPADLASPGAPDTALARGRSVVLYIVETLSFEESSLAKPANDTTPFLVELSAIGPITTMARAQTPYSTKAIYSILTGRYASPSMEVYESQVKRLDSLARTLKSAGYETRFLSTQFLHWQAVGQQFEAMGFDDVVGGDKLRRAANAEGRSPMENSWGLDDQELARSSVIDSLSAERPFFLVLYNTASHNPYVYDKKGAVGSDLERYRRALRTGDAALRDVATRLKERDLYDRTLFVMLGDHGEDFESNGKMKGRGCLLNEASIDVPLVFALPGWKGAPISVTGARQIDVAPTILDLLGVRPDAPMQGRSLLHDEASAPALYLNSYGACEVAGVLEGTRKLVYDAYSGRAESHDLVRDPGEGHPEVLAGTEKEQAVRRLRACDRYNEAALTSLLPK